MGWGRRAVPDRALRVLVTCRRLAAGRRGRPTAVIVDTQSWHTETPGHLHHHYNERKREQVHLTRFRTRAEAKAAVFDYIEIFYNRQRLHSALGHRTPAEVRASMEGITMLQAA
jgi:transposase InsO family protein